MKVTRAVLMFMVLGTMISCGGTKSDTTVSASTQVERTAPTGLPVEETLEPSDIPRAVILDGVAERASEPPETVPVAQAPTTEAPCQAWTFPGILFEPGSTELTPEAITLIAQWTVDLDPRFSGLDVIGHTDIQPIPGGNQALSESRATVVADVIIQALNGRAIAVTPTGRGDTELIDLETTAEAHARNRRVEVYAKC